MEQARIITGGLYFATSLAMFPFSVSTKIRDSFKSKTHETAADATASAAEKPSVGVSALISL